MELEKKYRMRVESCIGTIIDVHRSVKVPHDKGTLLTQFENLRKAIDHMDMSQVSERDIAMVEQATNALLGEFRSVFESGGGSPVYRKQTH
jgi:hypothetical protein